MAKAKRRHPLSIEPTKAQAALHQRQRDTANQIFQLEQDLAVARRPSEALEIENFNLKQRVSFLEGQVEALGACIRMVTVIATGKVAP